MKKAVGISGMLTACTTLTSHLAVALLLFDCDSLVLFPFVCADVAVWRKSCLGFAFSIRAPREPSITGDAVSNSNDVLMGQWKVRLEGTIWDGTGCPPVTVRRHSVPCDFGKVTCLAQMGH